MVPPAAASADMELNGLKAQAEYMKQSLDQIAQRIEELEGTKQ
jgi:prefoldin subunit 5